MTVLITGGAGYIGTHIVYAALERGERTLVLDDLSTGRRDFLGRGVEFVQGCAGDRALVTRLITEFGVESVIHLAGSVGVFESVRDPLGYYINNTAVTCSLVDAVLRSHVRHFVYSSSASVYGDSENSTVTESLPVHPISPYGRSKLLSEWILADAARARDFRFVSLRYFNVAGADPGGRAGQAGNGPGHLIRTGCQVALGLLPELSIFGTDYPTRDGTGIRDYIHVTDLAGVHIAALDYLRRGGTPVVMNCGYGKGFSVREVVAAIERVSGRTLAVREAARREGDAPSLVADNTILRNTLGWSPAHDDLEEIVAHAYAWETRLQNEQSLKVEKE